MEAFASLPPPQENSSSSANRALSNNNVNNNNNANKNNPNENDPSFLSLSQFDIELQQQAQIAMQQEMDAWQDFENYLPPVEYNNINTHMFNHHQHQLPSPPPTTANDFRRQSSSSSINSKTVDIVNNSGLSIDNILSTIQENPTQPLPQQQQQSNAADNNKWSSNNTSNMTTPMSTTEIKLEYASPLDNVSSFSANTIQTSPLNQSSSSSFGSPDSMLHTTDTIPNFQSPDQILNDKLFALNTSPNANFITPLETPLHSPRDSIFFTPPTVNFQALHQAQGTEVNFSHQPLQ